MRCIISGCKALGAWGQEKDFFWTTSGPGFNSSPSGLTVNPDHHSLVCLGYPGYPLFTCQPLLQQLVCKTVLLKQWLYYLQFSFSKASLDGFTARTVKTNMISLLRSRLFWMIDDVPDNSLINRICASGIHEEVRMEETAWRSPKFTNPLGRIEIKSRWTLKKLHGMHH